MILLYLATKYGLDPTISIYSVHPLVLSTTSIPHWSNNYDGLLTNHGSLLYEWSLYLLITLVGYS